MYYNSCFLDYCSCLAIFNQILARWIRGTAISGSRRRAVRSRWVGCIEIAKSYKLVAPKFVAVPRYDLEDAPRHASGSDEAGSGDFIDFDLLISLKSFRKRCLA